MGKEAACVKSDTGCYLIVSILRSSSPQGPGNQSSKVLFSQGRRARKAARACVSNQCCVLFKRRERIREPDIRESLHDRCLSTTWEVER